MDEMQRPIGVFDSGVGGISVLRELVALMPNENFIFYGDSKERNGNESNSGVWDKTRGNKNVSGCKRNQEKGRHGMYCVCYRTT